MTRLAIVFLFGALLAASIVANFGTDVAARVIDALSSHQHQSQSRGTHGNSLGRVAQLLGGGSDGASGVGVVHALSVNRSGSGLANSNHFPVGRCAVTPYYEEAGVVIYHADCREVVSELVFDGLVLTDPPYGIQGARGLGGERRRGDYVGGFDDSPEYIRTVVVPVIESLIRTAKCVVLTPGNTNLSAYPQPASFGCFYQPAAVGLQSFGNVDAQPIFYYGTAGGGRMGKRTVQRLIRGGQLPVFRIGHQLRVRVSDLNEWTKAQQVGL